MYKAFYGFEDSVFGIAPDRRLRFSHEDYAEAFEILLEAMRQEKGFAVLTGGPGTGKTALIQDLAANLESDGYIVRKVSSSQIDIDYLARLVGLGFGLKADALKEFRLLSGSKKQQIGKGSTSQSVILLIDQAHDLSTEALEDLYPLFDLTARQGRNVQILLAGQEQLWDKLRQPECEQLMELVAESCRLIPLSATQTRAYIVRALKHMGWLGDPEISVGALRLIHEYTGGVRRLINLTMGRLLLHGSLGETHRLGSQDVKTVVEQMGEDHPELLRSISKQVPPSHIMPSSLLLPLDARAVQELDPDKPLVKTGVLLPDGGQSRNAAVQTSRRWPKSVARGNWKWVLAGLSAATISVYMIFAISIEGDEPVTSAASAPDRREQPRSASSLRAGQAAPARAQTPSESSAHVAAMETEMKAVDLRMGGNGVEDAQPDPLEEKWWIARSEPTSDVPLDPLVDAPASTTSAEIAEAMPPSGVLLESSAPIPSVKTEVIDLPNGVEGTADLESRSAEDKWWIARSDPASDEHQDPLARTPRTVLPADITEPVFTINAATEPSALMAPVETEAEIVDSRKEVGGAEDLAPQQGDGDSAITDPEPTSDSLENPPVETPATVQSAETTQTATPGDVTEKGQDRASRAEHDIGTLLAKAERALSSNRLTVPSGDNAYAYYRKVLARDPGNRQARSGVGRIVQRYRQLAKQRLSRGDARGAKLFASRGLKIWSRDRELLALKRQASKAQVAKEEVELPQVLEEVKQWFRSGDTNTSAFMDQ